MRLKNVVQPEIKKESEERMLSGKLSAPRSNNFKLRSRGKTTGFKR
jgi:hypothetical protein